MIYLIALDFVSYGEAHDPHVRDAPAWLIVLPRADALPALAAHAGSVVLTTDTAWIMAAPRRL